MALSSSLALGIHGADLFLGLLSGDNEPAPAESKTILPALAGGRLYVRDEQTLKCFDLSEEKEEEKE